MTDGEYLSTAPTFASYMVDPVAVRSGALTINPAGYLADGANPATDIHSFGPVVSFSTPYLYTPGDGLVMQVNHQGYTPATELNAFFGSRPFQNGVCDAISSTASGTVTS